MQGSLQRPWLQINQLLKRKVAAQLSVYACCMLMRATCRLHSRIQQFFLSEMSDAPSPASSSSPSTYIG